MNDNMFYPFAAYVQEVGRAGRDGYPAVATLYFNNADVASNVKGLSDEMREYCKVKTCLRQYICSHLGHQNVSVHSQHDCCDICRKACMCEICQTELEVEIEHISLTPRSSVSNELLEVLLQYFEFETACNTCMCCFLNEDCANEIVKDFEKYCNAQTILINFPNLSLDIAQNITMIVSEFLQ